MSISHYVIFFSLCLSLLHGCNARPLDAIDNKKDEKGINKVSVLPKTNKSTNLSNELGAATRGDNIREASFGDKAQKLSNDETDQSLVSVSWRLPRNKRGEKHPGFNSDYSPPKTHPPSHN